MFLKCSTRHKDGKEHRSWSIVESRRVGHQVAQRHLLYLGEINDSQRLAWQKSIEVFDEPQGQSRPYALFPEDRTPPPSPTPAVQVCLDRLRLARPRTWGACWLGDPLWRCYMQLVFVEEAFRTLKGDLGLRPIFHHKPERIEAHLFVAFLADGLSITLRQRLKALAGDLMPRVVFEKLATIQLLDVSVPTTDGRELLLVRRTEPDRDTALLLLRLGLDLPPQPPPRICPPPTP